MDENGTDTGHIIMTIIGGKNGQPKQDLPRTLTGHPALDEDERNTLRCLFIAYARHNPFVCYC
ncbi:Ypt Rab-GAP domain of gyp1p superfamily [Olea europaea subsp. europaea]|uniref:Ypt Rab-GAP domain of gyp1p superfamily n=1 Tax=Olea europaea subsp. europaea TaxID=158383 RepID=A0A8S0QRJ2_OLEEU|nr:Ypt Rab-GAP domain of gyp1p superfamily [Olea europaea subsp. europaea]